MGFLPHQIHFKMHSKKIKDHSGSLLPDRFALWYCPQSCNSEVESHHLGRRLLKVCVYLGLCEATSNWHSQPCFLSLLKALVSRWWKGCCPSVPPAPFQAFMCCSLQSHGMVPLVCPRLFMWRVCHSEVPGRCNHGEWLTFFPLGISTFVATAEQCATLCTAQVLWGELWLTPCGCIPACTGT